MACHTCNGRRWVCAGCKKLDDHCQCEDGPDGRVVLCPDCPVEEANDALPPA